MSSEKQSPMRSDERQNPQNKWSTPKPAGPDKRNADHNRGDDRDENKHSSEPKEYMKKDDKKMTGTSDAV